MTDAPRDWLYPKGDRPMCLACHDRPVYLGGKCGPCYAGKTCGATIPDDPRYAGVACSLASHPADVAHDARHGGGRLTWRSDVERRPIAAETNPSIYPAASPAADSDPGYRAAMKDAGRGGLLR